MYLGSAKTEEIRIPNSNEMFFCLGQWYCIYLTVHLVHSKKKKL